MKALIAAALLLVAGATAHASDMTAPRAYTPDEGPITLHSSFAGAYVGASVNWNKLDATESGRADNFDCPICKHYKGEIAGQLPDLSGEQFGAGFRAGYNWQVGRIYGGPLVMVDFGGASSSASIGNEYVGADVDFNVNIQGTIAGKLGVAVTDRIGLYGLVGWSFADVDVDTNAHVSDGETTLKSGNNHSKYVNGFAYGGGAEIRIAGGVTAFAEYQHVNLSNFDASGALFDCVKYDYHAEPELDTVRVGLTYTFN